MTVTYTIETNTHEGWMDRFDGFCENSTHFATREEAEEELMDAREFCEQNNYLPKFTNSLHIVEHEVE